MDHSSTLTGLHQSLGGRTAGGLDVLYTKLAVDWQNLPDEDTEDLVRRSLESLRESIGCDAVCIALLDPSGESFERVLTARATFAQCNPEVLQSCLMADLPWFQDGLEHLRLRGILDSAQPSPEQEVDGARLAGLRISSMLTIGFHVRGRPAGFLAFCYGQPQPAWSADHQLLLKLLGSSFAAGLAQLRDDRSLRMLEEREAVMIRTANDGTWDFDALNNVMRFSPRWKAIMGYTDETLAETPPDWRRLVHPDDLAKVQAKLREHLAGKREIFESVHRMCRRDGEWRWVLCRAKGLMDERGRLRRLIGVETDITEQKIYEEALFREKESAQITLQSIGDGVVTTDEECNVEYLNPVAEELTGWRVDDATGRPIDEIFRGFHEETCEPLENPLAVSIRRNRSIKSVRPTLLIRRDGNEIYIENTASPIRDDKGEVTGGVLVFHDVSEARELNRKLSYHASHDILTGLVNRREFESRLERALKSAKAKETSYALCYIDLDQFKIVNDSCGHNAGDALLSQLGALLKGKIRWRDTLARLGGDEFGLLLESCSLDEAMSTADKLREAIREHRFSWDGRNFQLGASVGVVPVSAETEDV
ncbi:MAG: diguanylate cyclase domain-containing protein, partial [Gammaproteobacteria bacterium]